MPLNNFIHSNSPAAALNCSRGPARLCHLVSCCPNATYSSHFDDRDTRRGVGSLTLCATCLPVHRAPQAGRSRYLAFNEPINHSPPRIEEESAVRVQRAAPTRSNALATFHNASIARQPDVSAYTSCLGRTASKRWCHLFSSMTASSDKASVTERSGQMAGLLKRLRGFANDEDSARIAELLEAVCLPLSACCAMPMSECSVLPQDILCRGRQPSSFGRDIVWLD